MTQTTTLTTDDTDNEDDNGVWVVAGGYADDPHPHIAGVYAHEELADEMIKRCRKPDTAPYFDSWDKFQRPVQDE